MVDKSVPQKKVTQKKFKRKYKAWIDGDILHKIDKKNTIFKQYVKCKHLTKKNQLLNEFKTMKNESTLLTRNSKKNYYEKYFSKNKENLRKTWQGIKEVINIKSKNFNTISCISDKNVSVTDPKAIANCFNKFYVSIADDILKKRKYTGKKAYKDFLKNPLNNTFILTECEPVKLHYY